MVGTVILGFAASNMVAVPISVEKLGGVGHGRSGGRRRRVLCFLFSHTEFDLRTNFRWKPSIS